MRKILLFVFIILLTACSKVESYKTPNELLLSIKDYSCNMKISYFSNKNSNTYLATQYYSTLGKYSMEFLDDKKMKINYENTTLNISSHDPNLKIVDTNYYELNKNPLFLSYFINTYFNLEESKNIKTDENSVYLELPTLNEYLFSAKLEFKNNLPYSLTYFDKNGNAKVNIIYSEFTFI